MKKNAEVQKEISERQLLHANLHSLEGEQKRWICDPTRVPQSLQSAPQTRGPDWFVLTESKNS